MTTKKPEEREGRVGSRSDEHPSVQAVRARGIPPQPEPLTVAEIRAIALEAGADDVGVVSLDHPGLVEEIPYVLRALPGARSLVSIILRVHPDNARSPQRSVANTEFHRVGSDMDELSARISIAMSARGHRTIYPAMAFPMEMEDYPGRTWVVSHKRVAVAAQLGKMGIHRSVIHPRFGSFILLGTVISQAEVSEEPAALEYNPCLECKLCVAACPVGAIGAHGEFSFSACLDHNYHEFMTGFSDFAEELVESRNRKDFRERLPLNEVMATWQGLAYKPSYKATYCIAVCPAGEDVLGGFIDRRAEHTHEVMKPLTERTETVYVVAGSDAEAHVKRRFPHKKVRVIRSSLRSPDVNAFLRNMPLIFQRGPAKGWRATFHFDFDGRVVRQGTVRIDNGKLEVEDGLVGRPDLLVRTDGDLWLQLIDSKRAFALAMVTGRVHLEGDRTLLLRFGKCFPR